MTDRDRVRRKERHEEYKLAYVALMLCYPLELTDLDGEVWKEIAFSHGRYEISNYGRVKSFNNGKFKILKPCLNRYGYLYVDLSINGKKRRVHIHRLVAETFIQNPENKATVDHVFNNKFDNYVENLRWATVAENIRYARDTGASKSGEENYKAKLTDEEVVWCRKVYIPCDEEYGAKALAEKKGLSEVSMRKILRGDTYKNAEKNVATKKN